MFGVISPPSNCKGAESLMGALRVCGELVGAAGAATASVVVAGAGPTSLGSGRLCALIGKGGPPPPPLEVPELPEPVEGLPPPLLEGGGVVSGVVVACGVVDATRIS